MFIVAGGGKSYRVGKKLKLELVDDGVTIAPAISRPSGTGIWGMDTLGGLTTTSACLLSISRVVLLSTQSSLLDRIIVLVFIFTRLMSGLCELSMPSMNNQHVNILEDLLSPTR